jgi:hypothetical protein
MRLGIYDCNDMVIDAAIVSANNLLVVSSSLCANSYVSVDNYDPRNCIANVVAASASSPPVAVPLV